METLIFIAAFVIPLAAIYGFHAWRATRTNRDWAAVATELGLTIETPASRFGRSRPRMSGVVGDVEVDVQGFSGGRRERPLTMIDTTYLNPGPEMLLAPHLPGLGAVRGLTMGLGLGQRRPLKEITIDDPAFDRRVFIHTEDELATISYLSPNRREQILELFKETDDARLTSTGANVRIKGVDTASERLVNVIRAMVDLAPH